MSTTCNIVYIYDFKFFFFFCWFSFYFFFLFVFVYGQILLSIYAWLYGCCTGFILCGQNNWEWCTYQLFRVFFLLADQIVKRPTGQTAIHLISKNHPLFHSLYTKSAILMESCRCSPVQSSDGPTTDTILTFVFIVVVVVFFIYFILFCVHSLFVCLFVCYCLLLFVVLFSC